MKAGAGGGTRPASSEQFGSVGRVASGDAIPLGSMNAGGVESCLKGARIPLPVWAESQQHAGFRPLSLI
jgi:hypothetical protein